MGLSAGCFRSDKVNVGREEHYPREKRGKYIMDKQKGLYLDRTFSSDCHHCYTVGNYN
jgi:hypothetical protein